MPKIGIISDTHTYHRQVSMEQADLLLVPGDFSMRSREEELLDFLQWIRENHDGPVVLVCGNHDRFIWHNPERFHVLMEEFGIHYLENSEISIQGIRIWGSSIMPPVLPGLSRRFEVDAIEERERIWAQIPAGVDIVLTHTPPAGILDLADECHHGCTALLNRLEEIKPSFHIFGHIHQGYGRVQKDGITYINASLADDASLRIRNKPQWLLVPD